ncbi:MAG: SLBB domain-containing protein [Deltaproteobacteria bacterium]|nr:MAG: SLBB domain-containing protein [Deltaproteobacteria bacterium]
MLKQTIRILSAFSLIISLVALPILAQDKAYIIGPGDVLSVVIFAGGKTQDSLNIAVSSEGTINFPFLGKIKTEGFSIEQVTEMVTRPLAEDYFVNPQVIINVKDYKSKKVYITGAVENPGLYPLDSSNTTLLELISKAGGVTKDRSNFAYILKGSIEDLDPAKGMSELVQQKKSVHVNLRELLEQGISDRNIEIQAGDVVYIPPTTFSNLTHYKVYVLGKVEKPGVYDFQDGLTALDACVLAGGFAKYSAPNRTVITRRQEDSKQETIMVNLDKVRNGKAKDIELKPGDRIYVPESWL